MVEKNELRKRMRQVRAEVDDRLLRSVDLWRQVAELPGYRDATTVMAFKGFGSEPDTDSLFARVAADGKRLLLPRVDGDDIVVVDATGPMERSRIGVEEPTGPALPIEIVEFVIVPGLAFTLDGLRLGYGGGYYDRFLPKTEHTPNVGVCFTEQLLDTLPAEPWDIRVQQVVSA